MTTTDTENTITTDPITSSAPVARLRHPRAIRWLHWVNFPLLFVMFWSGLRIYWAEDVYALGIGSWQWFAFFPDAVYETFGLERRLARGMAFHFSFGWLIVVSGFAIYKPTQLHPLPLLFGGYQGARLVHFTMTIGLVLFFLIHVLQVARAGWNNFRGMVTGYEIERRAAPAETNTHHDDTSDRDSAVDDATPPVAGGGSTRATV